MGRMRAAPTIRKMAFHPGFRVDGALSPAENFFLSDIVVAVRLSGFSWRNEGPFGRRRNRSWFAYNGRFRPPPEL